MAGSAMNLTLHEFRGKVLWAKMTGTPADAGGRNFVLVTVDAVLSAFGGKTSLMVERQMSREAGENLVALLFLADPIWTDAMGRATAEIKSERVEWMRQNGFIQ